tara:strand:- start:510 stop:1424 length:915 start_codon:yes stop_codon:yes gene_type:complete
MEPKFKLTFFAPKYWMIWIFIGLWRLVIFLPFPILLAIGWCLGSILFLIPSSRKHVAKKNIEICFPDLTQKQKDSLLFKNFINVGLAVLETGIAWWWSSKRLSRIVHFEGLEHLDRQNGVLLLGIHYTTLEIGAASILLRRQMDGMYREHKNEVFNYIQLMGRRSKSNQCILYERRDVRSMMKALKNGRTVWYGPDQDYGLVQGMFVPFFGNEAATVTGTSRFARVSDAAVVPFSHIRLPRAKGYKVVIYPKLENFPSEDVKQDTIRVNAEIERLIMVKPDQYLWVHRRFKNRPEGEKDFYQSS